MMNTNIVRLQRYPIISDHLLILSSLEANRYLRIPGKYVYEINRDKITVEKYNAEIKEHFKY